MKKMIAGGCLLSLLSLLSTWLSAQSVGINSDGTTPNPSAILDVKSTGKGLLIPRMTSPQRNAIPSPAKGLLVFDIDTNSFWYYGDTSWINLIAGWSLAGNAGTNPATHFIGTSDNAPLVIKVNNEISGQINVPANLNTGWGFQSLKGNTAGNNNSAMGAQTLFTNTTGNENTATGMGALYSNTTGSANTATGTHALTTNTTGDQNTAIGTQSLGNNTTGSFNTAIGRRSMINSTSGFSNTAIGENAMTNNTTGSLNTAIGNSANVSTGNLFNATAIGFSTVVDASNKIRIGNGSITVIEGQVPFTSPSDGRFKFNVQEDVKGLDFILQLRPVTYQFDTKRFDASLHNKIANQKDSGDGLMQASYDKASAIRRTGFIAQEVEQAAIKTNYNFSGIIKPQTPDDHYSLSYESFVVPLVKAVQEQQTIIANQEKEMKALLKRIEALEKK